MNKLSKFVSRLFSPLEVLLLASVFAAFFSAIPAYAVNSIPLKPDSANSAPCTIVGSPYGQIECGAFVFTPGQAGTGGDSTHGLYKSSTVVVTSIYMTLISSGGAIVNTATPSISTSTILGGVTTEFKCGTDLIVTSTDAVNTVTLQSGGTLTGSQLRLGSATRIIAKYDILELIYDCLNHAWVENGYTAASGN